MVELTSNQKSFIQTMTEGDVYEQRGFELLLKRADYEIFFDALANAGLFEPARNPAPVTADKPGYFRVPYWYALDYLKAVAGRAGEKNDGELAQKVLNVVRTVTAVRKTDGSVRDNHHTAHAFAEILGQVPTSAVSMDDIDLIPEWLGGRFDRSIVGHTFAGGTLRHFVDSNEPEDWRKACRIVHHCTAPRLSVEEQAESNRRGSESLIDDYWLKELISTSAGRLGARAGRSAAEVFLARLREVYGEALADRQSWLSRPAIEENEQNHSWDGLANRFVDGLREVLLGWIDHAPDDAQACVDELLLDDAEIVRRIAIHVVDRRFDRLRSLVPKLLSSVVFDSGLLHELYLLLSSHFPKFSEAERSATLDAIRQVPVRPDDEDRERRARYMQRQWLSAISGKGSTSADEWFQQLSSDQSLGGLSPHPEFHSYMESHWGSGPSPYTVEDLLAFAESGTLIERLNGFTQPGTWEGPTVRSLVDALQDAVGLRPTTFLHLLPTFLGAKREFQYGVIHGFKKKWDASTGKETDVDWNDAWPKLIKFFEQTVGYEWFWLEGAVETGDLSPNRDWIPPVVSEFLRAGVRSDDKAYDPALLARAWSLIATLLSKSERQSEASEADAMSRAVNSSKGKAVEAMFDHALRACRVSDRANGDHIAVWQEMKPVYDREIGACRNDNFEFSTLAGAYISHLHYISSDWFAENFRAIFPSEFPANCLSAIDGLAFAPPSAPVYAALADSGVLAWALRQEMKGEHARENLIQLVALNYLWGREELNSPQFSYLWEAHSVADLEVISKYFWTISNQPISDEQIERILLFWDRCVTWSQETETVPANLFSSLALLSSHLKTVGDRELTWLIAVAPHVSVDYNADRFIEDLERLANVSPGPICRVLGQLLDTYRPSFDFEDKLKKLLTKLAQHGETRLDALSYTERLVGLPGMIQLFAQLTSSSPSDTIPASAQSA
jgi:hypothetical protein